MRARKCLMIMLVIGVALTFGCASATFKRDAYRGLSVSAVTYETTMASAADLYAQGKINDEQKARIFEIAEGYYLAYHCAVDALVIYKKTSDQTDREKVNVAIAEVSVALSKLLNYLKPFFLEE